VTVWRWPRVVTIEPPAGMHATALVSTSPSGWGVRDLVGLAEGSVERSDGDASGPVAVAAAISDPESGARLVVLGSAEAMSSEVLGAGAVGNHALASSAIAWLAGTSAELDIGPKTPERVRLIMTDADRQKVFALSVVGLPLAFALLGAAALAWRRREPRPRR
jgi:hypothetical protein